MTSQGTAHGRFTRAIANGNLRGAEMAARELGGLSAPRVPGRSSSSPADREIEREAS